jgi:hypothetical protein
VRSGSRPIPSFLRVVCAALALTLAGGGASAQLANPTGANPGDLGLREGQEFVPTDQERPDGQTPAETAKKNAKKAKTKKDAASLPALQPYRGAHRLGLRGGPAEVGPAKAAVPVEAPALRAGPDEVDRVKAVLPAEAPTPGPTIAAIPAAPPLRKIPVDENPYDQLGLRLGDINLKPYIEEDGGWASNPAQISGPPRGSTFSTTEAGVALQSDWSRSDVHGQLKAGYTDYFQEPVLSAPYGSGTLDGRYDVSKDLSFDGEGRFNIAQESDSSLGLGSTGTSAIGPLTTVTTYGATAGGAQKFGDLTLGLHGTYDRTDYQSVVLPGAGNLALDDNNDWGLLARASYRLSAAISPFVELGVDRRIYDSVTDSFGLDRDSYGETEKIGATVAFSKLLSGEASVGYGERQYQDPRLRNANAPLVNGSLAWSVTPLTTITFKAQSALADAVLAGASADVTHSYTIDVSHALTRQITLDASAGYSTDRYIGTSLTDSTTTVALKAEYHLSREVVLKASASRQQYFSNAPNSNYVDNVFMLGVHLQR